MTGSDQELGVDLLAVADSKTEGIGRRWNGAKALDGRIADLHGRIKTMRYRHQPVRRVHIPKGKGKTRPIGISSVEDKLVQGAIREVLEAVYEPTFYERSYGFRPGRGPHDAVRTLKYPDRRVCRKWCYRFLRAWRALPVLRSLSVRLLHYGTRPRLTLENGFPSSAVLRRLALAVRPMRVGRCGDHR